MARLARCVEARDPHHPYRKTIGTLQKEARGGSTILRSKGRCAFLNERRMKTEIKDHYEGEIVLLPGYMILTCQATFTERWKGTLASSHVRREVKAD